MSLFTNSLLKYMKAELLVGPASLMTSLDMNGLQVSILQLDASMKDRLLSPTSARAWPVATPPSAPTLMAMPLKAPPAKEPSPVRDEAIEAPIRKACEALIAAAA